MLFVFSRIICGLLSTAVNTRKGCATTLPARLNAMYPSLRSGRRASRTMVLGLASLALFLALAALSTRLADAGTRLRGARALQASLEMAPRQRIQGVVRRGGMLNRGGVSEMQRSQFRRTVSLRAEPTPTLEKEEVKEDEFPSSSSSSSSPSSSSSSSVSSADSLKSLDFMLGGDDPASPQSMMKTQSGKEETKAGHALDVLSDWFGPDEQELEAEKYRQERQKEAEERSKKEQTPDGVVASTTEAEKDTAEKMPDDVMKSEMAESLLKDLKERAKNGDEKDKELVDAVTAFLNTAQQYQNSSLADNALRNDFVNLLDKLQPENAVDREDMKEIERTILGTKTFYVTSSDAALKFDGVFGLRDIGWVFCGNFRGDQTKIFEDISARIKNRFEGKYDVLLIPDPELEVDPFYDGGDGTPKAALQVVPAERAQPPRQPAWAFAVSVVLFGLTAFGALQLGGQAASIQLPAETVKWLGNPDNFANGYDPTLIPPGVASWDPSGFLASVGAIAGGALSVGLIHELGHRVTAFLKDVKLGNSFFLPFGGLPTSFGSITPFKSLIKNNKDLFDIAASGPLSGLLAATALFVAGLALTGSTPQDLLVAIPYPFVQQSLLLGTIVKMVTGVGEGALSNDALLVHPLVVAGWVGLVAQAFNSLPVGSIDGGRMVQAAWGSGPLGFTSLLTYGALGFGLIGGPVDGLFFGLYLLFLQRTSEKYIKDTVTLADDQTRRVMSVALVIFAVMVLTPLN
uniref:Peptidase M50 domain-containing protein n=1 Tax=Lotharella globosa TaxID=91324 RepID=A0A7S3YTG9_9EUKA|mmetsp:Transcript_22515/g.45205  ORF Transcript_22515/g.45205 Transcript_22515/m.45205 type:complete len:745 (+) Transcript_22515:118-2352(+)